MTIAILIFRVMFPDVHFGAPTDEQRARMCEKEGLVCGPGSLGTLHRYDQVGDQVLIDGQAEIRVTPGPLPPAVRVE